MSQYTVSWGPGKATLEAETSEDAWALFAEGNDLAARQPKLHERRITKVEPVVPVATVVAKAVPLVETKPAFAAKK